MHTMQPLPSSPVTQGPSMSQWQLLKAGAWSLLTGDDYYRSNHYLLDR